MLVSYALGKKFSFAEVSAFNSMHGRMRISSFVPQIYEDVDKLPTIESIEIFHDTCQRLFTSWINLNFGNILLQIENLINFCITAISQNVEMNEYCNKLKKSEILDTLLIIVDLNAAETPLHDAVEGNQTLLARAFTLLVILSDASKDVIVDLITKYDTVQIILNNFVNYSVDTKIGALRLLINLYSTDIFLNHFKYIFQLLDMLFNEISKSTESQVLQSSSWLLSNIARKADILNERSIDLLYRIFCFIFQNNIEPCYAHSICGLFYLLLVVNQFLSSKFIEDLILNFINSQDIPTVFYIVEILKLCYISYNEENISRFHQMIDFNVFHGMLKTEKSIQISVVKLFQSVVNRGGFYVNSLIAAQIFEHIGALFDNLDFDLKEAILELFSITLINCDALQINALIQIGLINYIKELMFSIESTPLLLKGLLNIAHFDIPFFDDELIQCLQNVPTDDEITENLINELRDCIKTNENLVISEDGE